MRLDTLLKELDNLSWEEQMAFEMSERHPETSQNEAEAIEAEIRRLALRLTPSLLDALEEEQGYIVWVLRLSLHVPGDDPVKRAKNLRSSENSQVRYWAEKILSESRK